MEKYTVDTALLRLQEITETLEKGECDLDSAMKIYEEGVRLAAFCSKTLNTAKQKVIELSELDETEVNTKNE